MSAIAARSSVVEEIAERRRADLADELARVGDGGADVARPAPRPIAARLAAPGLHIIAELKRSSPSAGRIAADGDDLVTRARAYEAGGAAAISVLCEPHWFNGSVDDLRRVREAVSVPILAKEFVVDPRQLPLLRAAGADVVLLLAVLHPEERLADLVSRAFELGLEPLVEAHTQAELEAALATDARLIGINNRDLRTLEVDTERADRLRSLVPDDRIVIAESGVRDASTIERWRALAFDGALVGEALMRADDPAAAVRSFVNAGRQPSDPANVARRPYVKICGITTAEGLSAAVHAGADAVGLNVVAGTPRALAPDEAIELAAAARSIGDASARPDVVLVTADMVPEGLSAVEPDVIQFHGSAPADPTNAGSRRRWGVVHVETGPGGGRDDVAAVRTLARARRGAGPRRHGRRSARRRDRRSLGCRDGRRDRPGRAGHAGRWPDPGQRRRGASGDPSDRRGRRIRRRVRARRSGSVPQRTRSRWPCSSSAPRPRATTAPTSRSDPRRFTRDWWMRTVPGGGGWSATSAVGTCPRR